jgi:RimJ/RimL family protein N-acetyltransferase
MSPSGSLEEERHTLTDGTPVVVRPIRPDDAPLLSEALRELSPASQYQRFLTVKDRLSDTELDYLTHCDQVEHVAYGVGVVDPDCAPPRPIAVARCIRETPGADLAEVAITVADDWQGRGAGTLLFQALARRASTVGIRRWRALLLAANLPARRLLDRVGELESSEPAGFGAIEVIYRLRPPHAP